jgi:DNA end-binding protein Ku
MRYPEELVDAGEYTFPKADDVRRPELEMARTLVENLADTWDPSQYTDQYRENLMRIIRAKMKGRTPRLKEEAEPQSAEVVDLMERLRQSLQSAGTRPRKSPRAKKPAARGKNRHRAA